MNEYLLCVYIDAMFETLQFKDRLTDMLNSRLHIVTAKHDNMYVSAEMRIDDSAEQVKVNQVLDTLKSVAKDIDKHVYYKVYVLEGTGELSCST